MSACVPIGAFPLPVNSPELFLLLTIPLLSPIAKKSGHMPRLEAIAGEPEAK
jgi:hypothetical protein